MTGALVMLIAIAIDVALGWPQWLYHRIGHPVTWIGWLIARGERRLNAPHLPPALRQAAGVALLVALTGLGAGLGWVAMALVPEGWAGILVLGILAWPLVAVRSMHEHVAAVAAPLAAGDLPAARGAVAMIVGRDPDRLDAPGVARAALESLAENTSDGIVAPVFWGCILGLPGIAAYKVVNTLDSMIGHRSERYARFGWASARFDDFVNLVPARLTALILALASTQPRRALAVVRADARRHRSPNAGWPEAALAGAIGRRLSGPRAYGDRIADEPYVNAGAPDPAAADIARGLALYRRAMGLLSLLLLALALA